MANPLFNQFGQQHTPVAPFNNFYEQFKQFVNSYNGGDPKQVVQNLIQSGKMSQDQFNQYSQIANQIFGGMRR